MTIKFLLAAIAVIGSGWLIRYLRKQPPQKRPRLIVKYGLFLLVGLLLALVVTGKAHWITAGIAALTLLVIKLAALAVRFFPVMQFWKNSKQHYDQAEQSSGSEYHHSTGGKMTLQQAKEIFGLETIESIEQITRRHRELMQKNHPDRGGSDYLAAQINQAKAVLVDHLNNR